jgi:transposase-like protein
MSRPSYPKTLLEFVAQFNTDEACLNYLIEHRWPDGFVCPFCNKTGGWWLAKYRRFECSSCHKQTSPLAGTIMHRSHLPVHLWFWAAYLVATHTPGISAVQLQRQLGLKNDETSWFLLHRLRKAMVAPNRELLKGTVEADETHIGGPAKGKKGRGVARADNKTLIAGAIEVISYRTKKGVTKERAGRLRLQVLSSANEIAIQRFLNQNVVLKTTVKTDGWLGYSKNALKGYGHDRTVQRGLPPGQSRYAPHIHQAFGNLKAWLLGTHHGVDAKYIQSYLDEFVFRFNRREHPMAAFSTLLGIASSSKPLTLRNLVKP